MGALIKEGDNIIVNVPYMEAYIPEVLFSDEYDKGSAVAYYYAEGVKCIGLFNIRLFESEDQPRYSVPLKTLNYPNMIETYPSEITTTNMSVDGDSEPERIVILKYFKGDTLMSSTSRRTAKNCEAFLNYITSGKSPSTVPVEDIYSAWISNFKINSTDPGIPKVLVECMLATLARSKKDPLIPYRKVVGTPEDEGYFMANAREVTAMTNVMASLTFEDQSSMLTTSINMVKKGIQQTYSPFEKILSM